MREDDVSEMIERVARAILKSESEEADFDYCKSVDRHPLYISSMVSARAAIEAMREPTEAMTDASNREMGIWTDDSKPIWQAGIDAALGKGG